MRPWKKTLLNAAIFMLALSATQRIMTAQQPNGIEGVWTVDVTITDCHGNLVRQVQALNLYIHNGSFTETAVNVMRTPSVGTWNHLQANTYSATFHFYRYTQAFTFASLARATQTVVLSPDGGKFTATGFVDDFLDLAETQMISRGCVTESGIRVQ